MTGPRIGLAKEVVRLALRRLQPQDKAGIVEFYGSKRWAAPIQSAANRLDLNRALNRLTAGGGTVIFPAIEEAEFALKNVNTRTRHVIILTDGGVESGPFETLARRMADEGMTVSTVLVGPGQYSAFLAQWGRGRFYHAPDRFALPELILHQPQTDSPPPVTQTPSPLLAHLEDDITRNVPVASAPPLSGYMRVRAKPVADVILQTLSGDPILTRWNHGRGRVAALSTALGSTWTGDFAKWSGAAALGSNLCRSLDAPSAEQRLSVRPIVRPAGVEVQVDCNSDAIDPSAALTLQLLTASGAVQRELIADPIRSGTWNVLLANVTLGDYELRARTPDGPVAGRAGVSVPVVPELSSDAPNQALLAQLRQIAAAAAPADFARCSRATSNCGRP
jgi:hypothetical protein